MVYRHTIDTTTHVFDDLRDLLAKATPPRSGDRLAGIAAESAEQMVAARMALADVPLTRFLQEAVVPYEDDEVTRLILDGHDAAAFAPVRLADGGIVPRLPALGRGDAPMSSETRARRHAGDGGGRLETDAQPGSHPGRQEMRGRRRASATPSGCAGG